MSPCSCFWELKNVSLFQRVNIAPFIYESEKRGEKHCFKEDKSCGMPKTAVLVLSQLVLLEAQPHCQPSADSCGVVLCWQCGPSSPYPGAFHWGSSCSPCCFCLSLSLSFLCMERKKWGGFPCSDTSESKYFHC